MVALLLCLAREVFRAFNHLLGWASEEASDVRMAWTQSQSGCLPDRRLPLFRFNFGLVFYFLFWRSQYRSNDIKHVARDTTLWYEANVAFAWLSNANLTWQTVNSISYSASVVW